MKFTHLRMQRPEGIKATAQNIHLLRFFGLREDGQELELIPLDEDLPVPNGIEVAEWATSAPFPMTFAIKK